jgi:aryl-alcohol dehydrogenase-like predicted oxidoreductase
VRARPLGKTGLVVSEMGLGTWGLSGDGYAVDLGGAGAGDQAPPKQAKDAKSALWENAARVVARALDIGITLFETADAYAAGRMEKTLGEALRGRSDVVVVTKGGTDRTTDPPRKRFDPEFLRKSVERSCKRLGRDRLDVYLLHNPSTDAVALGQATGTLEKMREEGLLAHWGVSAGNAEVARVAIEKGARVVELLYNLIAPLDLHRLAGDIMVAGCGVLARSTLNFGLLSGTWAKDRSFDPKDHRTERWTKLELERRVEQLDAVRFLVKGDVHTLRGAAVRFVLSNHLVASAVLGPRTVTQLEQLVRETGGGPRYLSDEDLAALPRALSRVGISS